MQPTASETVGYRLSPQQELLLVPGDRTGASQLVAELESDTDADRLRRACTGVLARHEIARTTFAQPSGMRTPQQVIADALADGWWTHDDGLDELGADAFAARLALEVSAVAPHDGAPLVRALMITGTSDRVLALTAQAASADELALIVLLDEICAVYGDRSLAVEPIQYADYAEWRHELIADDAADSERGRGFWEQDASNRPPAPRILFSGDRPSSPRVCESVGLPLDPAELAGLRAAATATGVTPAVLLEGAWHALLARITGEGELLVGTWLDGRTQPDLAHAAGSFTQPVPVRTRLTETTTFAEILDQIRRAQSNAARWQDCASAADLAALADQAAAGFVYVAFKTPARPVRRIARLTCTRAAMALELALHADETSLDGELRFDPSFLGRDDAIELARRYATLLRSAVADTSAPVARLEISDPDEHERLLDSARVAATPPPRSFGFLHAEFAAQAQRTPDRVAVAGAGAHLTYAELELAANRLAHHLHGRGAGERLPVGLCMERSPALLVALLAILKSGAPYVPLNFAHPAARIEQQLTGTGAQILVTESALLDRLPEFAGTVVCVDTDDAQIAACPATSAGAPVAASDLAYVMHTSGSTGAPKGVAVTHANVSAYLSGLVERLGPSVLDGWRFGLVSAVSTDLGNTSLFTPLVTGGCVQMIGADASMDTGAFADELGGESLDALKIAPSHLRALLDQDPEPVLPRRWLITGGEALSWDLVDRVRSASSLVRILNHYGPTETTIGCCTFPVHERRPSGARTVPIGQPFAGVRAHVLDRDLQPLPDGVPGELCIGGATVASGYIGERDETDRRFVPDPFSGEGEPRMYRTGDRVRRLRDGDLEFLGRLDDQVKIRGFRIEPGEIEAALELHPDIRQAAVAAPEDGRGGRRLVAYIVATQRPSAGQLDAFLRKSLPDHCVPSAFAFIESLPLTASGKVDRRSLPDLAELESRPTAEYVAPRDEVEEQIAAIWSELLDVERVGVFDDFFALGGHSLLATQAIMRIRKLHGDIPLRVLLAAPTVASVAQAVRGTEAGA